MPSKIAKHLFLDVFNSKVIKTHRWQRLPLTGDSHVWKIIKLFLECYIRCLRSAFTSLCSVRCDKSLAAVCTQQKVLVNLSPTRGLKRLLLFPCSNYDPQLDDYNPPLDMDRLIVAVSLLALLFFHPYSASTLILCVVVYSNLICVAPPLLVICCCSL